MAVHTISVPRPIVNVEAVTLRIEVVASRASVRSTTYAAE